MEVPLVLVILASLAAYGRSEVLADELVCGVDAVCKFVSVGLRVVLWVANLWFPKNQV